MPEINTEDSLIVKTAKAFNMPMDLADPLYACAKILKDMENDYADYKVKTWIQTQNLAKLIEEILCVLKRYGISDRDRYIVDNILETAIYLSSDPFFSSVLDNPTKQLKEWMEEEVKMRENSGEVKIYYYNRRVY